MFDHSDGALEFKGEFVYIESMFSGLSEKKVNKKLEKRFKKLGMTKEIDNLCHDFFDELVEYFNGPAHQVAESQVLYEDVTKSTGSSELSHQRWAA